MIKMRIPSNFYQNREIHICDIAFLKSSGHPNSGGASGPSHSGQGQGLCSMSSPSQGVGQSHFRTRTW